MITVTSNEMNSISNVMIANNHYTIKGLRDLVDSYNNPSLSLALDCVLEEGTIDTIIKFFNDNTDHYPEVVQQSSGMDMYTYTNELIITGERIKEARLYSLLSK